MYISLLLIVAVHWHTAISHKEMGNLVISTSISTVKALLQIGYWQIVISIDSSP